MLYSALIHKGGQGKRCKRTERLSITAPLGDVVDRDAREDKAFKDVSD
jgi:hypothetical protein